MPYLIVINSQTIDIWIYKITWFFNNVIEFFIKVENNQTTAKNHLSHRISVVTKCIDVNISCIVFLYFKLLKYSDFYVLYGAAEMIIAKRKKDRRIR